MKKKKNISKTTVNADQSIAQISDALVSCVRAIMRNAKTEEDLKIQFEGCLSTILDSIGVNQAPRYERHGKEVKTIYSGRPDAVHGQVVIEYEPPNSFRSKTVVNHAFDQLVGYMTAEAHEQKQDPLELLNRLVGVGIDGHEIFFVRYRKANGNASKIYPDGFVLEGPFVFDQKSAQSFLTYLRSLSRLPLTAEFLADKFGPKSELAPMIVSALADALENWGEARVQVFFNEWKRLFGIVYGEQFSAYKAKEAEALSKLYEVGKETDFQELLFSVHTYFALLMKLIAAELITLKESAYSASFSQSLVHTSKEDLHAALGDIEDGGIYAKRGITNFLEGDFFRWYLDAFSPRLHDAIQKLARGLSEFEPATTTIDPAASRDLLKKLYEYLVPKEVRHKLGEYYTPDWLAELLIKETGYNGDTHKRFLDPACGSGTFLVLAIQQARAFGGANGEPPLETAKNIIANIWGFDLNPLAVIASRTNYLFALGGLIESLPSFEIPIYLADSVLTPTETSGNLFGEFLEVRTSVKKFHIPAIWVENHGLLILKAAPLVEEMVKRDYSPEEAMKRFKKEGLVFPPHEQVVEDFYVQILELQKAGKDGIWARFLKNAFAPMIAEKFDFVIGNPPWIRWDFLSQEYRDATLQLWKDYGLFSLKGFASRLGGAKKDFSMLFTYAAADYFLKNNGKLGFLVTQEVFKSKGAGEGFRRFKLGQKGGNVQVLKAHDLVEVKPFEGAANKSAAIIFKKGKETTYPLPYFIWKKKKGAKIRSDMTLDEVRPSLIKKRLIAQPMGKPTGAWQTFSEGHEGFSAIEGKNAYTARSGAYTSPYGVFWLKVDQVLNDGNLLVSNLAEKGKRDIPDVKETIEPDLVFPVIRGSDIERWKATPKIFALITQDPKKRVGFDEHVMKQQWERTYGYLTRFREFLISQAAYKKYHEEPGNPFYSQYNVAEYTFSRYKVVWKQMTNDLIAAVISQADTPFGYKAVIPLHTTAIFPVDSEAEAHYLCAIVNSSPIRQFIKSYSSAGRGFGTPSIMKHIGIPKYDPKNKLSQQLSDLSEKMHNLKAHGSEEEIQVLEKQNDELVKNIFKKQFV